MWDSRTRRTPSLGYTGYHRVGYLDHVASFSGQTAFNDVSKPNKFIFIYKRIIVMDIAQYCMVLYKWLSDWFWFPLI